jgi:hypothetical protein
VHDGHLFPRGKADDSGCGVPHGRRILQEFSAKLENRRQSSPAVSSKPNATLKF